MIAPSVTSAAETCSTLSYSCRVAGKLADVAKQAGVSEATVSRVLNGKPGISDATRAAVLTALDVIGYERPTHLRVRRARMVGLIVPELQNPIFPALAEVVAGALAQRGFNAVLCTRTGSMSEAEYVEMLLERQVSGMIFAGGQYAEADAPHEHYARLVEVAPTGRPRECRGRAPATFRASRPTMRSRWSRPTAHLAYAGPHADRAHPRAC